MTAKRNTPLTPKRRELDPLVHSPTAQAKRREPWLRFVAAVAHDFTEADLGLMAWSTVKGLVAHVGIVDPMDVALVQVHWQEHASRTEAKRALIAKQAREAAEERQREEDARVAAEEKAKRDREEAARLAAEAEVEAAQRKKLGLSTSRFSTSPRTSLGTRPSSLGVRRSASPTAVAPSASAAKSPAVATGGARKPSASPDSRAKAVSTPPSATQPPISSLTKVSTNVPSRVTPRPNSAVNGAASPKPTTPVTPSSARKVVVTEPAKQTTPRPAAAPVTALTSKASTSSAAPPVSSVASPPSPATRTRTAEAKAAAIFSKATAAPSPAAAPATNTGVTSPDPVAARTSVELDLFLATPDRREARSASPFSNPVLGDDGEPLSVDDVKSIFKEWCLYAHGTTDKAINFGRFMRWMKAIGIVDRHFLPRDAEVAFRSAMQQYHSIEAKRAANGASPADSPHRAPSVASLQSVATAAGDGAGERMPYHVFRMKLMPELASKLRCTVSDLVKRFHYCGGPKEASPKKRVDIYYSAATAPTAL